MSYKTKNFITGSYEDINLYIQMKAIWNGKIIAHSDDVEELDGTYYFPVDSIKKSYFLESEKTSVCPYKGKAHYYHIFVDGKLNEDAAWYYPEPKEFSYMLKNKIAFWKGVEIKESDRKIQLELLNILNSFF